jgi:hypothetical protein
LKSDGWAARSSNETAPPARIKPLLLKFDDPIYFSFLLFLFWFSKVFFAFGKVVNQSQFLSSNKGFLKLIKDQKEN